jgi:hypothetical protein
MSLSDTLIRLDTLISGQALGLNRQINFREVKIQHVEKQGYHRKGKKTT